MGTIHFGAERAPLRREHVPLGRRPGIPTFNRATPLIMLRLTIFFNGGANTVRPNRLLFEVELNLDRLSNFMHVIPRKLADSFK